MLILRACKACGPLCQQCCHCLVRRAEPDCTTPSHLKQEETRQDTQLLIGWAAQLTTKRERLPECLDARVSPCDDSKALIKLWQSTVLRQLNRVLDMATSLDERCCDARGLCSPRKPSHGLTPTFSSLNRIDIERFVQDDGVVVVVGEEFAKYDAPAHGDDLEPSGRRSMQARPFCPRQSLVGHLPNQDVAECPTISVRPID